MEGGDDVNPVADYYLKFGKLQGPGKAICEHDAEIDWGIGLGWEFISAIYTSERVGERTLPYSTPASGVKGLERI